MTREEKIKKQNACRDEVVAVLKKYGAELVYTSGSSYGGDGGSIQLKGVKDIPESEIKITHMDWSM